MKAIEHRACLSSHTMNGHIHGCIKANRTQDMHVHVNRLAPTGTASWGLGVGVRIKGYEFWGLRVGVLGFGPSLGFEFQFFGV